MDFKKAQEMGCDSKTNLAVFLSDIFNWDCSVDLLFQHFLLLDAVVSIHTPQAISLFLRNLSAILGEDPSAKTWGTRKYSSISCPLSNRPY